MSEVDTSAETPVLEVGDFYAIVTETLERRFSKNMPHTIRGEIAKIYEKGHLYLDIVDAGSSASDARRPVLNAHCWTSKWNTIKRDLADAGTPLKPGMVVSVTGYADVYAAQGKVGFTVTDIAVQDGLGDLARRRQELIGRLMSENVIGENRTNKRDFPELPLRIGLIASPGTEGYADFKGQLTSSGFRFDIVERATLVQGDDAPRQIIAALRELDALELDALCIVRGGGSKGDLACFDDEDLARAIGRCAKPVFTGIGHTGDISIADWAASFYAITPTKLGETLATTVRAWYDQHVGGPAQRIVQAAAAILEEQTEFLAERRRTMGFAVRDRLTAEQRHLTGVADRLRLHSEHVLERASDELEARAQLVAAYDPTRRLEQGWALVSTNAGQTIRSVSDVSEGVDIRIRLRDGHLGATVTKKESNA